MKRNIFLATQIGALQQLRHDITPDYTTLRRSVDDVLNLNQPLSWDVESEPNPSVEEFDERLENFASAVQDALREADGSMVGEERALDELYAALLEGMRDALRQRQLSSSEDRLLDNRLQEVRARTSRLVQALKTHHAWQEAHNAMVRLEDFRGTTKFRAKLSGFCETRLKILVELVEKELAPTDTATNTAAAGSCASQTAVTGHLGRQPLPLGASDCHDPTDDLLRCLLDQLERLCESQEEREYDTVRSPFDEAFYYIDKRTLKEVEQAHERVKAVEALLEDLRKARQKTG
jgi:hypothetical protein